jgi:hypothetical protein
VRVKKIGPYEYLYTPLTLESENPWAR